MRLKNKENRWTDPEKRQKLGASFEYIARWADPELVGSFSANELEQIEKAAEKLGNTVQINKDLRKALKYAGGIRQDLQLIVDFEKVLRQRPEGDPYRCDPQLRTAIRRASQFLSEEGATFQYC